MFYYIFRAVFIPDQRFQAFKQPDNFWTLQIKYVQARDAGSYECQVSMEPKVSSRVHLQVVGQYKINFTIDTGLSLIYTEMIKLFDKQYLK